MQCGLRKQRADLVAIGHDAGASISAGNYLCVLVSELELAQPTMEPFKISAAGQNQNGLYPVMLGSAADQI